MTKMQILKISNLLLFIAFISQALSGLVLFLEIKPLDGPTLDLVHGYSGLVLVVLIVLHIYLHWPAVKGLFFRKTQA